MKLQVFLLSLLAGLLFHQAQAKSYDLVHANLITFSSSSTSDIRLSHDGLPCQGILLSSGRVVTAPACARKIGEPFIVIA